MLDHNHHLMPERGSEIPEDRPNQWMEHMRNGAFEEAWKESDVALQERAGKPCWHLPRHLQYIWDGSTITGKKVLIRCYHGLGDTIQFLRYIPKVKQQAEQVIVWVQAALIPLLETIPEIDMLLPLHEGTPEVSYDVDVEIMELPYLFRSTLADIPTKIPYLQVPPRVLFSNNDTIKVGLVWKAGDWDSKRSIPFSDLTPLSYIVDAKFYILQAQAPLVGWDGSWGTYLGEYELYEYAQVVSGLDLLITIDSMPAHLAGAIGIPVWTLLHTDADWRWMSQRNDSPWYPTMRLFRQKQSGVWASVVEEVRVALEELTNKRKTMPYV
jgi:hypothetical protein